MKIKYVPKQFRQTSLDIIEVSNSIIVEYQEQGFDLTLRQLYYQMVARDLIANQQKEYDRLGKLISDARLAGLVDWQAIVDRTRHVRSLAHWNNEASIIQAVSKQFRIDKWDNQKFKPRVWIEKDALIGVISGICEELDVSYFSCRGYVSQSAMWREAQEIAYEIEKGKTPIVIHLGDHDPSGIDMTRDIRDRLELLGGNSFEVKRIALNYDQVETYNPPPNPTKLSDTRATAYVAEFGDSSWELDALNPATLSSLVEDTVLSFRDEDNWAESVAEEDEGKRRLVMIYENYGSIIEALEGK